MKILNFGSINFDYTYQVDHIVIPGETQQSFAVHKHLGGKGFNQSIALRRAGVPVFHAGLIGPDGDEILNACKENGIDSSFIQKTDQPTGHTIIQVDKNGQNSIILYPGSNDCISTDFVDEVLKNFGEGDILLLQNEINMLDYIIDAAYQRKITIVLNPSPYNRKLDKCDLSKVSVFLLNEIEGKLISNSEEDPDKVLNHLLVKYPQSKTVLTLGKDGAVFADKDQRIKQGVFPSSVVDTTAAGDTFTGYFLYGYIKQLPMKETMALAAKASSITISRAGAVSSIPTMDEVESLNLK